MLIPAIDEHPERCVALPDAHVIKLPVELLQMASVALQQRAALVDEAARSHLLRATHTHHPYTRWVCSSDAALVYTLRVGKALCAEKRRRYPQRPPHAFEARFDALLAALPAELRALPAELRDDQMPAVAVRETSVPSAQLRAAILGARTRAHGFRLYYWHTKRPNARLWRFGGAEQTRTRRAAPEPAVWAQLRGELGPTAEQ